MRLACLAAPAPSDQWKREGKRQLSGVYNMALLRPTEKSPHLTTPLVTVASLLKPRGTPSWADHLQERLSSSEVRQACTPPDACLSAA